MKNELKFYIKFTNFSYRELAESKLKLINV